MSVYFNYELTISFLCVTYKPWKIILLCKEKCVCSKNNYRWINENVNRIIDFLSSFVNKNWNICNWSKYIWLDNNLQSDDIEFTFIM